MFRLALTFAFAALVVASAIAGSSAAPAPVPFSGTWRVEQIPPGGTPRRVGMLTITQNGNALAGTLNLDGTDVPVANVNASGSIISFSVRLPGNPPVTLNYSGAIQGNQLGVASQDLGSGSYTLTAQRATAAQVAQAPPAAASAATAPALRAPSPPAAASPSAPSAPRAPAAPPSPALGAPDAAGGDYIARLLGQTSPSAGPAPSAPPPAASTPPPAASTPPPATAPAPRVASAAPPAPSNPARAPAAAPPPETGPSLEGSWSAEQTTPTAVGPSAATLSFTRDGIRLAGLLRSGGQEFPLFDVRQAGADISFSLVIPGTPYETVVYNGTLAGDRLEMTGLGEKLGAYALTATRQGASPAPLPRAAAETAPQVATAPPTAAPQVAVAPPPPTPAPPAAAPQVTLAPPPPTPAPPPAVVPPPAPALDAAPGTLQGNWIGQMTRAGSASNIQTTLSFAGEKASMRIGAEDLPLYDVTQLGHDVSFTVIVPGTPYVSVRYSGILAEDMMQLTSLDEGQGVFTLQARRADERAMPAAGPPPAQSASLPAPAPPRAAAPPSPPAPAPAAPRVATPPSAPAALPAAPPPRPPSPPSALPLPQGAAASSSAPPARLSLPALRDMPANGLAMTPPMGWASRQKLGSRTNDAAIRQAVEGLVESGLNLIGYVYVEIGDGWQGVRDAQGVLHPNERFPDMKALGDYIRSQGLEFGLTTSAAPKSCNGFEGSYGHETQDARTFAEWGVDYVLFDGCGTDTLYSTQDEMRAAFQIMGTALGMSGRDIVYAVSQPAPYGLVQWASKTGANVWRTGNEIEENWASIAATGFGQNGKESAVKPGAWNDPGLLQIGNGGLSADQSRMQLNLWAVLAAPMMLGNDVRIMTRETVALLSNRELIAINQDRMGSQGKRVVQSGDTQVWAKPLADGSVAVALFNTGTRTTAVAVTWEQLGIEGPRLVRDLWWHENVGTFNNNYRVVLTGGTSMLLKLSR